MRLRSVCVSHLRELFSCVTSMRNIFANHEKHSRSHCTAEGTLQFNLLVACSVLNVWFSNGYIDMPRFRSPVSNFRISLRSSDHTIQHRIHTESPIYSPLRQLTRSSLQSKQQQSGAVCCLSCLSFARSLAVLCAAGAGGGGASS